MWIMRDKVKSRITAVEMKFFRTVLGETRRVKIRIAIIIREDLETWVNSEVGRKKGSWVVWSF